MNNTTTVRPNTTITYPLDYYYAMFVNPVMVVRFYQIGYPITFLLGFIGNIASLITFSRLTLRKVSTGCLFIVLAVSDTLFLLMCVFDFLEVGLQIPFYHHVRYDELCRFRSFVLYVSQVLSSWTLVSISFDRWIRTRFPYRSGSLCTPKKALLLVGVLLVVDIGLHAHILTDMFGILIPGYAAVQCGPNIFNNSYLVFYYYTWSVMQTFVICLIPVILMLFVVIDMFINVRARKRAAIHPVQGQYDISRANQQRTLQLQMLILMLTSVCIFLITTLPSTIYRITSPRDSNVGNSFTRVVAIFIALSWFQSLNYAINFYSHCLTSTLFRKEFKQQMKFTCGIKQPRVEIIKLNNIARHTRRNHQ